MAAVDESADNRHVNSVVAVAPASARRRAGIGFAVIGGAALLLASVGLFIVSRGKWSDAIIDSGREWIVPDALARGDLLYRDVVYWFGPFTPYFHAAFFRLFGSNYATLVAAGIVASIGVLAALYFALLQLGGRREAILGTAIAIPALVFMPRTGGSILGMGFRIWHAAAFALVAVGLACRPDGRSVRRAVMIGTFAALSGLCRTEWGIAAVCGAILADGFRSGFRRDFVRDAAISIATFAVLFGGVIAIFIASAGISSVLVDGHLLFAGLPEETRTFLARISIARDWRGGILQLLYSTSLWMAAFLAIEFVALAGKDRNRLRRRVPWIVGANLFLALYPEFGGARPIVVFSAAPLLCAASILFGLRLPAGRQRAALVGFGAVGLLFSYRKLLLIDDSPYVGPPLLFALACAIGMAGAAVQSERDPAVRRRLRNGLCAALIFLAAFAFVGRWMHYSSDERVPVPGTNEMVFTSPGIAREMTLLVAAIRRETGPREGLVVFPEGEIVNYLAGRPNPIRHKLYLPGYLTEENEGRILEELEEARPGAVVILNRPTPEYGRRLFGENYGRRLRRWIDDNYVRRSLNREEPRNAGRSSVVLFSVRKR